MKKKRFGRVLAILLASVMVLSLFTPLTAATVYADSPEAVSGQEAGEDAEASEEGKTQPAVAAEASEEGKTQPAESAETSEEGKTQAAEAAEPSEEEKAQSGGTTAPAEAAPADEAQKDSAEAPQELKQPEEVEAGGTEAAGEASTPAAAAAEEEKDGSQAAEAEPAKETAAEGASGNAGATEEAAKAAEEENPMPELDHEETTPQGVTVKIQAGPGTFAAGTTVKVRDAEKEDAIRAAYDVVEESVIVDAVAVDITFYDKDGRETEPAEGHSVNVTIIPEEELAGENHTVVHILENGEAEKVEDTEVTAGDSVRFNADSFTIYAVIGTEDELPPTLTYYFHDGEGNVIDEYTQKVKEGETVYEPEIPEAPEGASIFCGWYEKDAENPFTDFGKAEGVTEDGEIHLYAKFSDKVALFYRDLKGRVIYTQEAEQNSTVTIQEDFPVVNTGSLTTKQSGWSLKEGSGEDVSGEYKVGTENVTLYPIIKDGFWVAFESNGGTAYDSQFIEEGSEPGTATNPGTPVKYGYTFTKWYSDKACTKEYDFSKKVTKNITLYAGYEFGEADYMVRYWVEKQTSKDPERKAAFDEATKTWTFGTETAGTWEYQMIARKSMKGKAGEDTVFDEELIFNPPYNQQKKGYELNTEKTVAKKIKVDGTTVMDVYFDAKTFNVTFNFPSVYADKIKNDIHVTDQVKYMANLDYIWNVIESYNTDTYQVLMEGRRFVWDTSFVEEKIDLPRYQFTQDTNWSIGKRGSENKFYRVWLETLDGKDPEGKEGVSNQSVRVAIGTVTDDRTYYLYHTGSFYAGWNGAVTLPKNYEPGFTAHGDYSDGNYKVGKTSGNTGVWYHAHTPSGDSWNYYGVDNQITTPDKPGPQYEYLPGRQVKFEVVYEEDNYLDVYFFRNQYNLNFHENGGEDLEDHVLYFQTPLAEYEPASYKEDETSYTDKGGRTFIFKGWYTESAMTEESKFDGFDIGTMPSYDIDLYAKWEPVTYTVTFDSNGGSEVPAVSGIEYGTSVIRPDDPTKAGYEFLGWTLDDKPFSFSSKVHSDITLVAQWTTSKDYGVKYDLNGGKGKAPVDSTRYFEGSGAQVMDLPAGAVGPKDTPVFLGWEADSDGELYYPGSIVTVPVGGLTLTAKWGAKGETTVYRLYYNLKPLFDQCGVEYTYTGAEYAEINVINNERPKLPETYSVPEGFSSKFVFEGWYLDEECTRGPVRELQVDLEKESGNNLYAKWSRSYTITYDTNGGVWKDTKTSEKRSETYSVTQSGVKIAAAPVREGYTFVEWKGSSYQPGETYNEKDPDGFYGDDTLVAQWKSNGEPEKDNDNEKGKDSTNTGDDMNPGAYASAMLISTIMLAGYVVWLRRKKNA